MSFGEWPPVTTTRLMGSCYANGDGTLAGTSKDPNGAAQFTSLKNSTGNYTVTFNRTPTSPIPVVQILGGTAAMSAVVSGGAGVFTVRTFDAAGAAVDAAFAFVLFDAVGP